ncbi:hypothetical protein F5X99DRAFT_85157 [Biscogniauxia marginata]|nr:hypothetical protein F5X99DRAFT_85157 [Biscogniauxia marginata]
MSRLPILSLWWSALEALGSIPCNLPASLLLRVPPHARPPSRLAPSNLRIVHTCCSGTISDKVGRYLNIYYIYLLLCVSLLRLHVVHLTRPRQHHQPSNLTNRSSQSANFI